MAFKTVASVEFASASPPYGGKRRLRRLSLLSVDEVAPSSLESSFRFAAFREAGAITITASAIRDVGRKLAQRLLKAYFQRITSQTASVGELPSLVSRQRKKMNNDFRPYTHEETRTMTRWRPLHGLAAIFLLVLFSPAETIAADLKPETIQAWNDYVRAAEERNLKHVSQGNMFLAIDALPAEAAKLRQGDIIASPLASNVPAKVPAGLIHDWTGAIFIPNAALRDVLQVVRNYGRYKTVYHPSVVSAKPLETSEWEDRFSMVVMNKSFFAKSALDSDYHSTFTQLDDQRWYSVTETTRVQEVAEYGGPSSHMLPQDHGTGIIWRLYSIARYQERDGGVYVELEAIALSRDIPGGLRWLVEPIVRRVSRSSIVASLQETADAVRSSTNIISSSRENPHCSAANCAVAATLNGTVVHPSATPLTSAVVGKGMHP